MKEIWIKHPIVLNGNIIDLIPLEKEHLNELFVAASNEEIWELTSVNYSAREIFYSSYNDAILDRANGKVYPFIIFHKRAKKIIGSTRFLEINPNDKKIEIGVTWITNEFWGTTVNLECKFLLLRHCFETLNTNRVQFRAKDSNLRSRKAIEKIGAVLEGILRKDKIEVNGTHRNTAFYSIINTEWEAVKETITHQIEQKVYYEKR